MNKYTYVTEEGLKRLKDELDHMMKVERPAISKAIGEAIEKGDISENAEYDAAKDAQGMLEAKIAELRSRLANVRVVDKTKIDTSSVKIMNVVRVKNLKLNKEFSYTIVPDNESDIKAGKIAVSTPIAKGLIGHKQGDVVDIKVPSGMISFEILDISI